MRKRLFSPFPGKSEIQRWVKIEILGACLLMETCVDVVA
jgi:hypothetical protein